MDLERSSSMNEMSSARNLAVESINANPVRKGRKVEPETLKKYLQIMAIYKERPNDFTRKQLCEKHGVKYGSFMQWAKNQQPKSAPKFRPELIQPPPFVGQSILACTVDDLVDVLSSNIREAIKEAIKLGIKYNKIKVIRS